MTCRAEVGLTEPKRLADGAAIPMLPESWTRARRVRVASQEGTRTTTLFLLPVTSRGTDGDRSTSNDNGPGQKARASISAAGVHREEHSRA